MNSIAPCSNLNNIYTVGGNLVQFSFCSVAYQSHFQTLSDTNKNTFVKHRINISRSLLKAGECHYRFHGPKISIILTAILRRRCHEYQIISVAVTPGTQIQIGLLINEEATDKGFMIITRLC